MPTKSRDRKFPRLQGDVTIDLDYLIDRLEELLDRSTRIPATSRVIIDEDDYLRLIDQMRISVPQEIKNARKIENERDALLAAAQVQADSMIDAGRERAEALSSDHEIVQQAQARAERILDDALARAEATRADADAYALEVLEGIAIQIEVFHRTVSNGIALLRNERAGPMPPADDGDMPHADEPFFEDPG